MAIVNVEIAENSSKLNLSVSEESPSELNLSVFEETTTVVVQVVENQIVDWTSTSIDGGSPESANLIQVRRGTASNWASVNPILTEGEVGVETDGIGTGNVKEKIGDGVKDWNSLPYKSSGGSDDAYSKVAEVDIGGVRDGDTVESTVKEALDQLLSAPFKSLTYSYSINYSLVEKGLSVTPTSTWNIAPNDDTVTDVSILRNNIEESNQGTALSGSYLHLDSIDFSSSTSERTYKIDITSTDAGLNSTPRSVAFVAPTYAGVLAIANVDETNIKTITKYVRSRATQNNISFSPVLQRYIYAYPKSFGLLSSIKDPSNFEVIGTFDVSEITFTLADGTSEIMYIYVSNADTTQTNFLQDFIF